jgi:tetratricopeptide (TPR) repeat protein
MMVLVLLGLSGTVPASSLSLEHYRAEGQHLYEAEDFRGAARQWQRGLAEARLQADDPAVLKFLTNLGAVYAQIAEYGQARAMLGQAILLAQNIKDRGTEGMALTNLGNVYQALDDYPAARVSYMRALEIAGAITDRQGEAAILNNLGEFEEAIGDYVTARARYEASLAIANQIDDWAVRATVLGNLGNLHAKLGDWLFMCFGQVPAEG